MESTPDQYLGIGMIAGYFLVGAIVMVTGIFITNDSSEIVGYTNSQFGPTGYTNS